MEHASPTSKPGGVLAFIKKHQPWSLFAIGALLLIASFLFMGLFIQSSLDLELHNSMRNRLQLHMDAQTWRIRELLGQGLPQNRIIRDVMQESFTTEPSLIRMSVSDEQGKIKYSADRKELENWIRFLDIPQFAFGGASLPGKADDGWFQGSREIEIQPGGQSLVFSFLYRELGMEDQVKKQAGAVLTIALVLSLASVFVILLGPRLVKVLKGRSGRFKDLGHLLLNWDIRAGVLLLVSSLGIFAFFLVSSFASTIGDAELMTARYQLKTLASIVGRVQQVEPEPGRWGDMGKLLRTLLEAQDSSHFFYIREAGGRLICGASRNSDTRDIALPAQLPQVPRNIPGGMVSAQPVDARLEMALTASDGSLVVIGVVPDQASIDRRWQSALIDILSLLVVVFILALELFRPFNRQVQRLAAPVLAERADRGDGRLLVFLLFSGLFMSAAIFPQQAMDWLSLQGGANLVWVMTLAVSSWLLGVAILTLASRFLLKRMGFQQLLMGAITLCVLLFALNLVFSHILLMIALRLSCGFVHGTMAMLAGTRRQDSQSGGFCSLDPREWNAAFASGAIVGISTGGILATRFGYGLSAGLSLLLLSMVLIYLIRSQTFGGFVPSIAGIGREFLASLERKPLFRFVMVVLLVLLPLQLATQGLFYFLFPLYMTNLGMSYGDIARVLAAYGVVGMLTPVWKRMVQGYRQERMFIIASHMVVGISIMSLSLQQDLAAMVVAALSMGVAAMLNDGISYQVLLRQPGILGTLKDLEPWQRLAETLAAVLIPLVGAGLAIAVGIREGIFIIGGCSLTGAVAFTFFADNGKRGVSWK